MTGAESCRLTTRFAPSPTGELHLGHALAAWAAWSRARQSGGRFLLRFEDIDPDRCRPEFRAAIEADLRWLGLDWDGPALVQSSRLLLYRSCLNQLAARSLRNGQRVLPPARRTRGGWTWAGRWRRRRP